MGDLAIHQKRLKILRLQSAEVDNDIDIDWRTTQVQLSNFEEPMSQ